METKIVLFALAGLLLTPTTMAAPKKHPDSPAQLLKNHALATCIADGLKKGEAAELAAAAAREYFEHGKLPIEAYSEATKLGRLFLEKKYENIYGANLVFIKCIDFYNSPELDSLAIKFSRKLKN